MENNGNGTIFPPIVRPLAVRPSSNVGQRGRVMLQYELMRLPIEKVVTFTERLWLEQRLYYSTSLLTGEYRRDLIDRSLLCEYLHMEGLLMSMTPEGLLKLEKKKEQRCHRLMEITSWKYANFFINFLDYAVQELEWGQKLEKEHPGTFARGWFRRTKNQPRSFKTVSFRQKTTTNSLSKARVEGFIKFFSIVTRVFFALVIFNVGLF